MSTARQGQNYKFYKFLAWALLGAILTYIVCAMTLTTDHTTYNTPFYNCGEVDDLRIYQFRRDVEREKGYQDASGTIDLEQGEYYCWVTLTDYSDLWHYFCVRIDDLSADSIDWKVTYQKLENDEVTESVAETYALTEGMNALSIPDQKFDRLRIDMYGENGTTFSVGKIQLRENPPISINGGTIAVGILTVLCYLVLSWIIWTIYNKSKQKTNIRPYVAIEILQDLYLVVASRLAALQSKLRINPRRRRIIRTCMFLGIFCYSMWVAIAGNYYTAYRFHVLVYAAILSAIAVLSIEEKPTRKNWNNPLVWGWLITAVMMCVSDLVVQKDAQSWRFFGYIIIFFIGFFIFVWNNMKDRGEILEDFVRAIHIFFWISVVFCILFRPDSGDVRYTGFVTNPNGWGKYMAAFWAVALGSLDYAIRKHKKRRELLLYIIEACLALSFAWKTQSVTSLIAIALVAVFWLVRLIIFAFRNKRKRALMGVVICAIVLFMPLHIVLSIGLLHVPEKLGTAIEYEEDARIEKIELGTVAYGADPESEGVLQDNRVFDKLGSSSVAEALSGRTYIYNEYLRDFNLFGHESRPAVYGYDLVPWPHNEVLGRAYYYGIFTTIPYIIMLIAALERTWRFGRKKVKYAVVPFFACLSFVVISMAEVTDAPFHRLLWDCMYLLMGCVFCDENLIEEEDDPCYDNFTNNSQNISTPS